jgi:hypothetical protein
MIAFQVGPCFGQEPELLKELAENGRAPGRGGAAGPGDLAVDLEGRFEAWSRAGQVSCRDADVSQVQKALSRVGVLRAESLTASREGLLELGWNAGGPIRMCDATSML